MLTSTKDTVNIPVKMYTLECGYRDCPFQTGDHVPSTLERDHKWLLETHFELEHYAPPLVMVEGAVDRVSWESFFEWYLHYRDKIFVEAVEDRLITILATNLGDVGKLIRDKQGHRYFGLTELQLLMEVDKIANAGTVQLPEQDQLVRDMSRDTVAVRKQEEIIEDQQGIVANKIYDRSLTSGPNR
jgi:hypothetical protein